MAQLHGSFPRRVDGARDRRLPWPQAGRAGRVGRAGLGGGDDARRDPRDAARGEVPLKLRVLDDAGKLVVEQPFPFLGPGLIGRLLAHRSALEQGFWPRKDPGFTQRVEARVRVLVQERLLEAKARIYPVLAEADALFAGIVDSKP